MEVSKQALQNIISDEERLLFAENIPAEYLSDALGRRTGTADAVSYTHLHKFKREDLCMYIN